MNPPSRATQLLAFLVVGFFGMQYGRTQLKQYFVIHDYRDFGGYYMNASMLKRGVNPYALEHHERLSFPESRHAGPKEDLLNGICQPVYAPVYYWAVTPLTWLPYESALACWILLINLALVAGLWGLGKGLQLSFSNPVHVAVFGMVGLGAYAVEENMVWGETNTLILFFWVVAFRYAIRGREWLCGLCLTPVLLMKPQFGLIGLWWLLRGYYGSIFGVVAGYVGLTGLSFLVFPVEAVQGYYYRLFGSYLSYHLPMGLSIWTLLKRLIQGDSEWMILLPLVGSMAWGLLRMWHFVKVRWGSMSEPMGWAVALLSALVISPSTESHHLVMALFPIFILYQRAIEGKLETVEMAGWVVASALITFPYWSGFVKWSSYGRPIGIAVLLYVLGSQVKRMRSGEART